MTRPVQWTRSALDDIKNQIGFIAAGNPAAARRVASRIRATAESLGEMATGRPGRVTGTYEKSISRLPYVIAYAISTQSGSEAVAILRVIHAARDWRAEDWPE